MIFFEEHNLNKYYEMNFSHNGILIAPVWYMRSKNFFQIMKMLFPGNQAPEVQVKQFLHSYIFYVIDHNY